MLSRPCSEEHKRKISEANKGKILSEETKQKMSKAHKGMKHSKETKRKLSEARKGKPSLMRGKQHSEESKQKMSLAKKGKKLPPRSEEYRCKLSETKSRLIAEGKFHPGRFGKHGYFFSTKNNDNIYYESSYELDSFQILEQMVRVKNYQRCHLRVAYRTKDGSWHYYVPDILVTYTDGTQEVIEVKPECFVEDEINQVKFEAAKKFCEDRNMNFLVWTEKELNL